ncbi:MAG: nucleotidyltransferase family protein [Caulobacteraceae bacterium]|nr:nucleotidyltransferase family protein [Caulobacteraceae bacterium]
MLAAGTGSRFGGGKLLAPWGEGRLIDAALAAALAAPVRTVRGVVGDRAAEVADAAQAVAEARGMGARLRVVEAADYAEGMGASLRAGVRDLPNDAEGLIVFLADMPRIPHVLAAELARAVRKGALAAAPVCEGRRGHPVAFSAALLGDLAEVCGDAGAREVLKALGDRLALVPIDDPGVHFDVDRPEDL